MTYNPIIVIPSRLGSTRLPNKPLLHIAGLPMIIQVIKRVQEANVAKILVAAAEQEIVDVVLQYGQQYGIEAILTDPNHLSGSDRIKEALDIYDPKQLHNIVINVQGDLPTIEKSCILDTLSILTDKNYNFDIATLVAKIDDEEEKTNPNVVKAIVSWKEENIGQALYFTRSKAPWGEGDLYHHIGIYGYKRAALNKFTALPSSSLENREKLEQLRALENYMSIGVKLTNTIVLGVDSKEDLAKADKILSKNLKVQ